MIFCIQIFGKIYLQIESFLLYLGFFVFIFESWGGFALIDKKIFAFFVSDETG